MGVPVALVVLGRRALSDLCFISSRELHWLWSHLLCAQEEGESAASTPACCLLLRQRWCVDLAHPGFLWQLRWLASITAQQQMTSAKCWVLLHA